MNDLNVINGWIDSCPISEIVYRHNVWIRVSVLGWDESSVRKELSLLLLHRIHELQQIDFDHVEEALSCRGKGDEYPHWSDCHCWYYPDWRWGQNTLWRPLLEIWFFMSGRIHINRWTNGCREFSRLKKWRPLSSIRIHCDSGSSGVSSHCYWKR